MAVRSIISFAIVAHTQNIFEIIRQPTTTSQNILFNTQTVTPGKKNGEKHHLERIFQVVWPINYSVTNFFRLFLTKNGIFLKRRAAKFLFFRQWSNIIQRRVVFVMSFPLLYNIDNIQKMKFIQIFFVENDWKSNTRKISFANIDVFICPFCVPKCNFTSR